MVIGDVGKGRAGDIGKHRTVEEPASAGKAEQAAIAEKRPVAQKGLHQRLPVALGRRQCLGKKKEGCQRQHPHCNQRPEDRSPARNGQKIWPPSIGPSSGAIAITVISVESICAARSPV